MKKTFLSFLLLIATGLVFLAPLSALAAEAPASSPFSPALIPSLTPEQAMTIREAVRKGELTPEVRQLIESNPELKKMLPAQWREQLEIEESGRELGLDNTMLQRLKERAEKEKEEKEKMEKEELEKKLLEERYDWKKSVYISRLFLSRLEEEEAEQLVHFGHDLFDPRMEPEMPLMGDSYPVSDAYVIGPGDEIIVKLWGRLEGTHRMRVDREGKIFFPKLGPMYVAGKTVGELKTFLRNKVGNIAEVRADVSLGELKGFPVSVVGEVKAPGMYQVSSFHTALRAILMAGGIKDIGTLRRVQIKRGGETVTDVDIYDILLKGDITHDIRLHTAAAIFVPVAGPLVAVVGEVRRQAIYELKQEKSIGDVLAMAGGLSPSAYKRRVQVERLEGNLARTVVDLNLEEIEKSLSSFALRDGDILRILSVLPEEENVVQVEGNVQRPGKYEWKPGLTVGSLIPDEKFFLPETFLNYALITRLVGPERRKEVVPVDLRKIVIERDVASDVALEPMDTLMVWSKSAFREIPTATVGGEVRDPGENEIHPGMRISDLVMLGGGLTPNASLGEAELSRLDEKMNTIIHKIDLAKALEGDESHNLLVQERDLLMIRPVPDLQEPRYITLSGEVRSPGIYAALKGERLSSILRRAGGFTPDAFLQGAVFTRMSVQKRQQELIDRTVEKLEQDVARTAAKGGATALDLEDVAAQKQVLEAQKLLLNRLKQMRAKGRVIVRMAEPEKLEGTEGDLLVEHGDMLEVPPAAEVVNVMGRVYNPTAVVYNPSQDTAGYYLRKVGGATEDADREHIFVVKADGSVMTKETVGEDLWFYGQDDFLNTRVGPGDAIVVPEKLVFTRLMKDIKDITQILFQIAVSAGVVIAAF
ncbi:MAG: SLBB domain-containing protein [Deltaproteobacteria bacterium]|nr:SLBB domain-containing protein [Deltaproteobacteria bacterium]